MAAVRRDFQNDLTSEELFSWHRMLMKVARYIKIGDWRDHKEPMQVISGPIGKEKIHYEAPPSNIVASEMKNLITWFNSTATDGKTPIKKDQLDRL